MLMRAGALRWVGGVWVVRRRVGLGIGGAGGVSNGMVLVARPCDVSCRVRGARHRGRSVRRWWLVRYTKCKADHAMSRTVCVQGRVPNSVSANPRTKRYLGRV
eukprot:1499082-Prymnesium_polylepis.1